MAQRVLVRVRPNGRIETVYENFVGDTCFDHANKLKAGARRHGLDLGEPETMQRMAPATPLQPRTRTKTGT